MSGVYIKTKIRSRSYAMKYLWKIRKKRILVVCDKSLAGSGVISYILDALGSSNTVGIFDQAISGPTIEVVGKGLSIICKVRPETVIGFGNGSAIDTAKGVIYFAGVRNLVPKPKFITIPTISGTGSEVTSTAVIADSKSKSKHLIPSDDILADVAILNTRLTLSVPSSVTANTGMDVLTRALEACVANGSNVFSDALSEEAIELLIKALLQCYRDGKNLEARALMHETSTLVGMAFNMAGLGLNRSIAHQSGGMFHIPHGLANALLLDQIIDYNSINHDIMNKYASLVYKVQLVDMNESPVIAVDTLKELVRTLVRCVEMSSSIRELGIDIEAYGEQLQNMTDNALMDNCLAGNPREAGTEAIRKILLSIY